MKKSIWYESGTRNLKIFLFISLGLHLLFIPISYIALADLKMRQPSSFPIEISLISNPLPTMAEGKNIPILPHRGRKQMKNEKSLPMNIPVPTDAKAPPANEFPLVLSESEKERRISSQEERMGIDSFRGPLFQGSSSGKLQIAMKNPFPPEREIVLMHPQYAENPKPAYPQEARQKGHQGEVILMVQVLSNGGVGRIEVKKSSGYEILDRSALHAVKLWKFIPARNGEIAIPIWVNVPIKFQLQ
jgi:protein TonB